MNENDIERIIVVKEKYEKVLLEIDGIHAVSIGYKIIDEEVTDTLAIVVHTESKKPNECLLPGQHIPPFIEGIPTDVVELPPFEPLPIEFDDTDVQTFDYDNTKYRPVPGGVEIYSVSSPTRGGVCTLGMFAHSLKPGDNPDDIYLLTNAHCLPIPDQAVRQPESNDPADLIAYESRVINSEQVDGGIAKMVNLEEADPYYIVDIGVPTGTLIIDANNIGDSVVKRGRTTKTTIGYIAYIEVTIPEKNHQIIIGDDVPFAAPGDSGSVVLMYEGENKHNVIGLLWGGALNYGILSPIQAVTEQLEIELMTREVQIMQTWSSLEK